MTTEIPTVPTGPTVPIEPVTPTPLASSRRPRRGVVILLLGGGVVVVAAIVGVLVLFLVTTSPTTYRSTAFGYSVKFPGVPTITTGKTSDGQPKERAQWSNGAGNVITIEGARLSASVPAALDAKVLNSGVAAGVSAANGTTVRDVSVANLDGYPARSEQFDSPQLGTAFITVCVKGSAIYVVTITRTTAAEESQIARTFAFTN